MILNSTQSIPFQISRHNPWGPREYDRVNVGSTFDEMVAIDDIIRLYDDCRVSNASSFGKTYIT